MTYKAVLVHVEATPECDARVTAAVRLAERFDAELTGLAAGTIQPAIVDPMGIGAAELIEMQQAQIRADFTSAEVKFQALAAGVRSRWLTVQDYPSSAMASAASAADLLVVGTEPSGARWSATSTLVVGDLLMRAGRPVIVAPTGSAASDFGNIVIAWKDTPNARRAIADALPLIKVARDVTLLHVEEAGQNDPTVEGAVSFLDRHGIKPRTERLDRANGPADEQIPGFAATNGVSLIVAGAYGHSRFREWALGGVTRRLLTQSSVACLLSH